MKLKILNQNLFRLPRHKSNPQNEKLEKSGSYLYFAIAEEFRCTSKEFYTKLKNKIYFWFASRGERDRRPQT